MALFKEDLQLANFADMKVPTMFIKKTFKGSKKLKELEIEFKCNLYLYFLL